MKKNILLLCYCLLISSLIFGKSSSDLSTNGDNPKESNAVLVVLNPTISPNSPYVICGSSTLTLNASPTNASYTYQWSFSTTEAGTYTNISGATSSTFTTNATNNVGFYKVSINDGTTPALSPAFKVRVGGTATLVNVTPSSIAVGGSSNLNFTFTGTAPWVVSLNINKGKQYRDYTFATSPATLTVTPDSYSSYSLDFMYDANGRGCYVANDFFLNVTPVPTLVLGTPVSTTVCAGNTIDIPLTFNGTWGNPNNITLNAELTTTTGTYIPFSDISNITGTSLKYIIPPTTPVGTYKIRASSLGTATFSTSYNITVATTGCGTNQPIIAGLGTACRPNLRAYPSGSGFTYQWYKDNIAISGETFSSMNPLNGQNGNYTVLVTNTSTGYSATSAAKAVTVNNVSFSTTATSNNICTIPITISSNYTGSGFTYQWYRSESQASISTRVPLSGQTGSTLSVSTLGFYQVSVFDGNCQVTSSYQTITLCPPIITSTNPVICGTNTQAVLQSSTNTAGIYQWSSATSEFGTYTNISGATSSSYTATTTGYYKVVDNVGTLSNAFRVNNAPYAVLLNPSGNTSAMNIASGGTAAITYKLFGTAPFTFTSNDGVNTKSIVSPTNQITLNYLTPSSRYYYVNNLVGAGCTASGSNQNSMLVNVGTPTLTVGSIASTICAGDVMSVPYTLGGTFDSNINIVGQIYNASTNAFITGVSGSTNPLQVQIPATLAAGTYYISLYGNLPNISSSTSTRTSNFTVTAACTPTAQASIQGYSIICSNVSLTAVPNGTGYNFQWSKNGNVVSSGTSSSFYVTEPGNYTVLISHSSNGYSSTSATKTVTFNATVPIINSPNASLCGANNNVTLTSSLTGSGYTYLWQKFNSSNSSYSTVVGQTTQSLSLTQVSEAGQYRVVVNDGNCDNNSANFTVGTTTTARLVNSSGNINAVNLNPGQTEALQLQLGGQSPWTYTFQGVSYTSNTPTVTLPTVSPTISTNYNVYPVYSAGTACGTSPTGTSSILVNVSPNPSFTMGAVATTACNGDFMEVPLTLTGNWGTAGNERFYVYLYTSAGSYISNVGYYSGTPLIVPIPSGLTVGNVYKFLISPSIPAGISSQFTSNFTISNTCPTPPNAVIIEQSSACSAPQLNAIPNGAGYIFQWKKDGIDILSATNNTYYPPTSGNYSVNIQNAGLSYNSTSPVKAITNNTVIPPVSSPNSILCGTNTSTTLSTTYTGAGYTYTWQIQDLASTTPYSTIVGATSSSITATDAGRYRVNVNNGTCTFSSSTFIVTYGGKGTLTNSNDTNDKVVLVSPQTTENLKVNLTGTGPWEVGINDGTNVKVYTTNVTPLIVPVSPITATNYSIAYVSSACGANVGVANLGSVVVEPAPVGTISFPTPSNLTVCKGNTISIPYTATGNIVGNKDIAIVFLADATGGSQRNVYTISIIALNPVQNSGSFDLYIPDNTTLGMLNK